ncbi:MAG: hypothetical protein E6H67_15380 [Betaproteobacteria bacterium]|nr:MAG: hypothetical protein E6H67_15380 [Betaproteobacteria bacterium]
MVAEAAGIVLGGIGWWLVGKQFLSLTGVALHAPLNVRRAVAVGFVAAYLAIALFPFDVILSGAELHEKLASELVGLWTAPAACPTVAICLGYALLEVAAGAMFGVAWNWMRDRISVPSAIAAASVGFGFGLGIELCQLFLLSGVSQGASVIARGLGIALGYRYAAQLPRLLSFALDWQRRRWWLGASLVVYLSALLLVNGWFRTRLDTVSEAIARLAAVQWVPFYYFYFVSEQWALKSAVVQVAMYAPAGVLVALAEGSRVGRRASIGWIAAIFGALLALVIETGKLFLGKHPDPTDILLALVASYMA